MERKSAHQVLSTCDQEEIDKAKIEALLKEHNLAESVDLILMIIRECDDTHRIDQCIEKVISECKEKEEERKKLEQETNEERYNIYSK